MQYKLGYQKSLHLHGGDLTFLEKETGISQKLNPNIGSAPISMGLEYLTQQKRQLQ